MTNPVSRVTDENAAVETTWRGLALQFDAHRMEALDILRWIDRNGFTPEVGDRIEAFLASPPLSGEAVLADRLRALSPNSEGEANVSTMVSEIEVLLDNCHVVEDIHVAAQHEAVMSLVRRLAAPQPQQVAVSDAMVERACTRYTWARYGDTVIWPRDFSPQEISEGRENMRAALTTALRSDQK